MITRTYSISGAVDLEVCGFMLAGVQFDALVEYEPADAVNPPNTHIEADLLSTYEELAKQVDIEVFPGGIDDATERVLQDHLEENWESYV